MTAYAGSPVPVRGGMSVPSLCAAAAATTALVIPFLPVGCSTRMSCLACGLALAGALLGLGIAGWAVGSMREAGPLARRSGRATPWTWLATGLLLAAVQFGSIAVGVAIRPACWAGGDDLVRTARQLQFIP